MKVGGSLSTRVLAAATVLLIVFFGLAFAALDVAFRRAAERALEDVLESQVLGLLAAAHPGQSDMLNLPPDLPEPKFSRPGSGLYGRLIDGQEETVWISRSAIGMRLPAFIPGAPGRTEFRRFPLADGTELMSAALRIEWEFEDGNAAPFVFNVSSSLDSLNAQIGRYRNRLSGGFAALVLILIGAQILVLRFLLRPLKQAEQEVREIDAGARQRLSDGYPTEIEALSSSVNVLIDSERARSERYRESLDNLAHSLKTPLAVIRTQAEAPDRIDTDVVEEQVATMQGIVDYQLRRATTGGALLGRERTQALPVAQSLLDALTKVYREKPVRVDRDLEPDAVFPGGRGDLTEILGNLLDNAFKFSRQRVRLTITTGSALAGTGGGIEILVEDDGPGLPRTDSPRVLERGVRGTHLAPGQGIGLAVVRDIIEAYGGKITLAESTLGGAAIRVRIATGEPS